MTTDLLPQTVEELEKGCLKIAIFFFLIGIVIGIGSISLIWYIWTH